MTNKFNTYKQKTIDNFITFLTEENVLDRFKKNFKIDHQETIKEFCNTVKPENYIIEAFNWLHTGEKEGVCFWQPINRAWYKLLLKGKKYEN